LSERGGRALSGKAVNVGRYFVACPELAEGCAATLPDAPVPDADSSLWRRAGGAAALAAATAAAHGAAS